MKKIGMVVAINDELLAVFDRFGAPKESRTYGSRDLHIYENGEITWYVLHCGAGEIGAAAATELLIDVYHVDSILNFGVVGGLTKEMALMRTVIVERVVHYDYDCSEFDPVLPAQYPEYPDVYIPATESYVKKVREAHPELKSVILASGDKFISSAERKAELNAKYGAEICDMEGAGIALTCNRSGVPFLMIKTISDGIEDGAEGFARSVRASALFCFDIAKELFGGIL